MKSLLTIGIAAICVSACTPSKPAQAATIESKVAEMAKVMSSVLPKKLGENMSFDAVSAEGDTLVLNINGIPEWRPNVTDADASKLFSASICNSPQVQGLVKEGAHFRIDGISPEGKKLPSLPICPR
jgi:hypothetical protein